MLLSVLLLSCTAYIATIIMERDEKKRIAEISYEELVKRGLA